MSLLRKLRRDKQRARGDGTAGRLKKIWHMMRALKENP